MTWQKILAVIALALTIGALLAVGGVVSWDPVILVIVALLLVTIILIA